MIFNTLFRFCISSLFFFFLIAGIQYRYILAHPQTKQELGIFHDHIEDDHPTGVTPPVKLNAAPKIEFSYTPASLQDISADLSDALTIITSSASIETKIDQLNIDLFQKEMRYVVKWNKVISSSLGYHTSMIESL